MEIYLSASSIKSYMTCSAQYYFRRYHSDEGVQTQPMAIGSATHEIVENYWRKEEEAFDRVEEICAKHSVKSTTKVYGFIENFFKHFEPMLSENDKIEERFKIPMEEGVYMVGKWDRVVPGGILFDWKTSKRTPNSIANDIQFMIYHKAYKDKTGKEPLAVYFASLTSGRLIKYEPNESYVDILYNEIIPNMLMSIREGRFSKEGLLKYFSPCTHCTFKDYCWNELAS